MKREILLSPLGDIEERVLDILAKDLAGTFEAAVKRQDGIAIPAGAFDPARGQYSSSFLLRALRTLGGPKKYVKVLAIADVDLYAPGLNFVFGEAEFAGRCAVISLVRLRQSFYSLPENKRLFSSRAKKEAVHELGHVWRLEHCGDPLCVMHFSNSLSDTDIKNSSFCPECRGRLRKPR
jgi:archaemetzincin